MINNKIIVIINTMFQILFSFYYTIFGLFIGYLFSSMANNIYIVAILSFLLITSMVFISVIINILLFIFLLDELIDDM